jgi:predicted RNase H-like nuclease (RuvC/YqgF family)
MSLWKIKTEYETILNDIIDDDGVVSEQAGELLAINVEKRDDTATNYHHIINNLQHENNQIDEEIKRLQALKKRNKTKIELLSRSIIGLINLYGEFKSDLLNFKTRKSTVVEVDEDCINALPENYITTKTTLTPNKTAIKTALKNGLEISGCKIVETHNLNIK